MPSMNIVKNKRIMNMFEEFSDYSRIWIYGFDQSLTSVDTEIVRRHLDNFIDSWHSHKDPVRGAYEILEDRFVVLVAEPSVSGCSVDSSINVFKRLKQDYQLDALNHDLIYYKDENIISALSRNEFQNLVDADKINTDTIVYNLTLTMLGAYRAGQWELPFYKSWHGLVFQKSAWSGFAKLEAFNTQMTGT